MDETPNKRIRLIPIFDKNENTITYEIPKNIKLQIQNGILMQIQNGKLIPCELIITYNVEEENKPEPEYCYDCYECHTPDLFECGVLGCDDYHCNRSDKYNN